VEQVDWFRQFEKAGRYLRLGMEALGSVELVNSIDLLIVKLPELQPSVTAEIQQLLARTLAAQERKDYLYVADLLEYEIAPCLRKSL